MDNSELVKIDLDLIKVDEDAIRAVSKEICHKFSIFPYHIENQIIYLASCNENVGAFKEDIGFILKMDIIITICSKEQYLKYMSKYYEEKYRQMIAEGAEDRKHHYVKSSIAEVDSPAVKIVDSLIKEGIYKDASDIHIEPGEDGVSVKYRIDGTLKTFSRLPSYVAGAIVRRIKIMGGMDISRQMVPQDGKIIFRLENNKYDFRVSTLPTIHGEKCVLRVNKRNTIFQSLENIGFKENDLQTIKKLVKFKQGLIIVTGPTGSGKSTTLYSMIREIDSEKKNIITIENPVECQIPGINQVSIEAAGNNTYESILRTALRQDPDIIMVGEIRDKATAEAAVNASLTGHLVLTTLHTNDASSTVIRLKNMGISEYLINDSLLMIISQRLARCICSVCRESYELSEEEREVLGGCSITMAYRGRGCAKCSNTGYRGRRIVYEMLPATDDIKKAIISEDSDIIRNTAVKNGMVTMDDYFKELISKGITTTEEYYSNMEIYNLKKAISRNYGV